MGSRRSRCALAGVFLLMGASLLGVPTPAAAQSGFKSGVTATIHQVVDLIAQGDQEGRAHRDMVHLRNALNQLLHVLQAPGNGQGGQKGNMGKGMAFGGQPPKNGPSNQKGVNNVAGNAGGGNVLPRTKNGAASKPANNRQFTNAGFGGLGNNVAGNPKNYAGKVTNAGNGIFFTININIGAQTGCKKAQPANLKNLGNSLCFGNVKNAAVSKTSHGSIRNNGSGNTLNHKAFGNCKTGQAPAFNNVGVKKSPSNAGATSNNLAKAFPKLGNYKILDNSNPKYNCVAYTLGNQSQWINPKTGSAKAPLTYMDQLYQNAGFHRQKTLDFRPDGKNQKVAVYATKKPGGAVNQITHSALMQSNGVWTSKLGSLPLIQHKSVNSLVGRTYGVPIAAYSRPMPGTMVGNRSMNVAATNRRK